MDLPEMCYSISEASTKKIVMIVRSTEQIAKALNKTPRQLYNHNTDAGPLYRLMRDGYVQRHGDSNRGFYWQAAGAEIVWM